MIEAQVNIRWLGVNDYHRIWHKMQAFTNARTVTTLDEIWLLEHQPVFTQGQNGKAEHILNPGTIPIIQTDRGGQVTYHGPGQLMLYTLIDLRRKQLSIREFVTILETSVCEMLSSLNIHAYSKREAPGVYVKLLQGGEAKICSIGLRVRKGCTYHGIAFNINMDLQPFLRINPCGFKQLQMTQLANFVKNITVLQAGEQLTKFLLSHLRYNQPAWCHQDNNDKPTTFL